LQAGNNTPEVVRKEIEKIQSLTNKPFGVNIMLLNQHAEAISSMLVDMKVPVIITGAGNPGKYMNMWKMQELRLYP